MKILTPFLILFLFACGPKQLVKNDNNSQPIEEESVVQQFIKIIKNDDKKKLSERTLFPLNRKHPIPEVTDKADFLKRYDQIFDAEFKTEIINSDPEKDWSAVGSRGIMYNNGSLWIDFSGSLFAVNHQSEAELHQANEMVINQNLHLHESIRVFEKPVIEMETKKYRIRIDNMGKYKYRYAVWPIGKLMSDKPDLILSDGQRLPEGSGGNHRYEFKNGDYRYEIFVILLGANDSPPALLNVYKKYELLITEDATSFKN